MATYQSFGCQVASEHHYCQSVKKIVCLVMQNRDFDSGSVLEKNHDFDLDLKSPYSTNVIVFTMKSTHGHCCVVLYGRVI